MLLDADCGRFLEALTLGIVTYQDNSYDSCMFTLGVRRLPALRTLFIGDFHREETELNWSQLGDAAVFYRAVPNLRSLTLRSGRMVLGEIDLPELRDFTTLTGGLTKANILDVATARWPKLEHLSLQIGSSSYDSDVTPDDLYPILDGDGLPPTLVHLGLANFEYANDIIPQLARSNLLPRLRELDLSLGTLAAGGAAALVEHAAAFRHLAKLDLSESCLDAESVERIRAVLPNAVLDDQRPDDFYIAAGE